VVLGLLSILVVLYIKLASQGTFDVSHDQQQEIKNVPAEESKEEPKSDDDDSDAEEPGQSHKEIGKQRPHFL
jgi:hypothetical protein